MGIGELVGMRWILWDGGEEMPEEVFDELARIIVRALGAEEPLVSAVGLAATATYLPERWMTAAEIGEASGIPEQVIVEKFGLRGKHIAAGDEHVSDMAVEAASSGCWRRAARSGRRSTSSSTTARSWKEYPVWQAAPWIAHRLGCNERLRARVRERLVRDAGRAAARAGTSSSPSPELRNVLLVAACRESYLIDYANERSRFMFNFGDGAVAGLLTRDGGARALRLPRDHGRLVLAPGEGAGGRLASSPRRVESVAARRHFLDVADPAQMKERPRRGQPAELRRAPPRGALAAAARARTTSPTSATST